MSKAAFLPTKANNSACFLLKKVAFKAFQLIFITSVGQFCQKKNYFVPCTKQFFAKYFYAQNLCVKIHVINSISIDIIQGPLICFLAHHTSWFFHWPSTSHHLFFIFQHRDSAMGIILYLL